LLIAVVGVCWVLFQGPSPTARNLFVHSLLETSAMKFVPSIFLSEEELKEITSGNAVIETEESTDNTTEFTEKDDDIDPQYAYRGDGLYTPGIQIGIKNTLPNEE
jgi:hypothetical protein